MFDPGGANLLHRTTILPRVYTIRVKRAPKPDPVKPRPPAARRFYFTQLAVPLVYIFVSSHVLANVTNAAPVPGYRRNSPRRFVFSSSAAPIEPPGSALLASPGATSFTSTNNVPNVPQ
jgi:hypothetical protein